MDTGIAPTSEVRAPPAAPCGARGPLSEVMQSGAAVMDRRPGVPMAGTGRCPSCEGLRTWARTAGLL